MFYLPGLLIRKTKDTTPVDGGGASRASAWAGAGIGGDESTVETEPWLGFQERLWPRQWSCRFGSLLNPFLQISQTNSFVANWVFGDRATTSTSRSVKKSKTQKTSQKQKSS